VKGPSVLRIPTPLSDAKRLENIKRRIETLAEHPVQKKVLKQNLKDIRNLVNKLPRTHGFLKNYLPMVEEDLNSAENFGDALGALESIRHFAVSEVLSLSSRRG